MDIKRWVEMLAINVLASKQSKVAKADSRDIIERSKGIIQRSKDNINSAIESQKARDEKK